MPPRTLTTDAPSEVEPITSFDHGSENGNTVRLTAVPPRLYTAHAAEPRFDGRRERTNTARTTTASLVIPARNESRNLAYVLEHIPPHCVEEIILVDGHSSDVTRLMAESCRPDIRIINEPAPGKGEALRAGFEAATGDYIVAMDADGSMSPEEIPRYLYLLENGFDFVKGSRFMGGGNSLDITTLRKLGNRAFVHIANTLFHAGFTDLCYGFFAFRRIFLENLNLKSSGFEIETEIMIHAVTAGLRIAEVPTVEMPRREGRSNLRTFRDGARVLETLLNERFPEMTDHVRRAVAARA